MISKINSSLTSSVGEFKLNGFHRELIEAGRGDCKKDFVNLKKLR
ncbi:hypothetical protein B835_2671 [Enterococcus mundtii 3F]|nr:hypothetical protein [Enterococcus mundtii]MDA9462713.1 hypothetical protein [Enterococcus mundtii 3F]